MKISKINQEDIELLKETIKAEEGKDVTEDQIISRVLGFYKKFVPFN